MDYQDVASEPPFTFKAVEGWHEPAFRNIVVRKLGESGRPSPYRTHQRLQVPIAELTTRVRD